MSHDLGACVGEPSFAVEDQLHTEAHRAFYAMLSPDDTAQVQRILDAWSGDIDAEFLGFLAQYHLLAQLIPRDRIVYDVGCAYAFQAAFFRSHRGYVGIDPGDVAWRFQTANATHVRSTLRAWGGTPDPAHFAIHSYCPQDHDVFLRTFHDVFTFYPYRRATRGNYLPATRKELP